jgi:hypothetical protein
MKATKVRVQSAVVLVMKESDLKMEYPGDNKILVIIPLVIAFGMFSVSVSVWLSGHTLRDTLAHCVLCSKCVTAGRKCRRKASLVSVSVIETLGKEYLCSCGGNCCDTSGSWDLKDMSTLCPSHGRSFIDKDARKPQIVVKITEPPLEDGDGENADEISRHR